MTDIKSYFTKMSSGGESDGEKAAPPPSKPPAAKAGGKKTQTIEKTYQKKTQLEHILLRPDTYIGSIEHTQELMWIYDTEKETMVQKTIDFVPGLYKIFDEILVNAADNKQRDKKMDCIKVEINPDTNTISVWNNGKGIPVAMHKDENMYVPTMIFGHLLTSSNYNDEEEKVTGGRNGYGAKLCNIFSTKFTVETAAKEYKRQFKQTWGSNMTKASEPKIKDFSGEDFTKVTFSPDLAKFKMDKLDDGIVGLFSRRAFDIAASTRGIKVYLNGTRLPVKTFKDYIDLYIKNKEDDTGNPLKVVYENANERWEVALTISDKGFQQVSFVNSIATTKGGRHVDYVTDMIVKQLIEVLKKKNKGGINIKPFQVKNHMWIFVNCLIVNPNFDSQTKENMTLQVKSFGSKLTLSEKFINNAAKSGIVESVLSWAKFKAQNELSKTSGKKQAKLKGIPKLEDANEAGTKTALKASFKVTNDHWDVYANFFSQHTDLARGPHYTAEGRDMYRKLWYELATQLNAVGLGEKSIEKWQKSWSDFKCALKRKAIEIHQSDGPQLDRKFSNIEARMLSILGEQFYQVCPDEEREASYVKSCEAMVDEKRGPKRLYGFIEVNDEELSSSSVVQNDHNYVTETSTPPPPSKKSKDSAHNSMEKDVSQNSMEMYRETIRIMENIRNTLDTRLLQVSTAIEKLASAVVTSSNNNSAVISATASIAAAASVIAEAAEKICNNFNK